MSIDDDILYEVQQSLSRCTSHRSFVDRFCANFKAADIPIAPFPGRPQKQLKEDLTLLVMCAGNPDQITHSSAARLHVPTKISKFWIDALLGAVRESDEKFTPELERKWRMILSRSLEATAKMGQKQLKMPA